MASTCFKPSGVPVFPPHGDPSGDCVLARLLAREPWRGELDWPQGFAGGIAHRLDVPTSGALLVADTVAELAELRAHFAGGQLRKTYRLLAARDVPWAQHHVRLPMAHDRRKKRRMVVKRGANTPHRGRWYAADTRLRHLQGRLWEAVITTGVMHQIRAHAAFVGLPLAGDRLYGGGQPPPGQSSFCLHHVGLVGPEGLATEPVALPDWAYSARR